jgi:hypothetical protein
LESQAKIFLTNHVNWILRGKWEGLRDCVVEKGDPIPWVEQVEGKRAGGLELFLE